MERQATKAEADAKVARAKLDAEIRKKQALIQAKLRKQALSSHSSVAGLSLSSWHSISRPLREKVGPRQALRTQEIDVGAHSAKTVGPGQPSGAAYESEPHSNSFPEKEAVTSQFSGVDFCSLGQERQRPRDIRQSEAIKRETLPNWGTLCDGPNVKSGIVKGSAAGRERQCSPGFEGRCPPGFEGVTPKPVCYVPEVGNGISGTSRGPVHKNGDRVADHGDEPLSSRKDFLDEAILVGYDGSNMPYIMFYNQIMNLLKRCYYPDRKLALLRAACVRTAAQTIAVIISDTPGFDDDTKISMALDRLAQRFGVPGGFLNEPEVQGIRNGPKMSSTSAAAWKAFKDELTQCFVFAHSYKKPNLLEGRFVVDLARRLPIYAKQRYLDFLNDRFGCTGNPSFSSLLDFVAREEQSKASDFGVQLMADEKSERVAKSSGRSGVSVHVKKTSAHLDSEKRVGNVKEKAKSSMPPKGSEFSSVTDNSKNGDMVVAPRCFVCNMDKVESSHSVVHCQVFRRMSPSERKDRVFKARRCFNCLENHLIKECPHKCDCRKCYGKGGVKHFFMLHDCFMSTDSKAFNAPVHDVGNRSAARNGGGFEEPRFSSRSVKASSTKAALNRVVAARVTNPRNGKSELVYCQLDGGSQLTFVSNRLVRVWT